MLHPRQCVRDFVELWLWIGILFFLFAAHGNNEAGLLDLLQNIEASTGVRSAQFSSGRTSKVSLVVQLLCFFLFHVFTGWAVVSSFEIQSFLLGLLI